jgi:hypothetical protein
MVVATLTTGPIIDYLVTLATNASVGIVVDSEAVQVVDGWPAALSPAMFIVGLSSPPPDTTDGDVLTAREWSEFGNGTINEDLAIPCLIDIRVGGVVQKTPRDVAESVFNNFWALIAADTSLGHRLLGGPYDAAITDVRSTPSNVGTVAEPGRRQLIAFAVSCRNLVR